MCPNVEIRTRRFFDQVWLALFKTKMNDREKFSRRFQLKSRFLLDVPCHEQPTAFSAFRRGDDANYTFLLAVETDMCNFERNFEFAARLFIKKKYIYKDQNIQKKHKI